MNQIVLIAGMGVGLSVWSWEIDLRTLVKKF